LKSFRGKGRSERLKPTLQSLASIHLNSDLLYEINKNGSRAIVTIYIIIGVLFLVTAIINYINISTAEFFMRAKNVGLKKILGINRSSLLLGHLVETMMVCAVAAVSGGILAWLLIPSFNIIMQTELVFFSADAILPFLLVYTITVVLSGLLPAIQIVRQDALIAFGDRAKNGMSTAQLRKLPGIFAIDDILRSTCHRLAHRSANGLLAPGRHRF
jgi:putative ABC transport system permease protein